MFVFCKLLDEGVIFGKGLFLITGRAAAIGKVRRENKDYPYADTDEGVLFVACLSFASKVGTKRQRRDI